MRTCQTYTTFSDRGNAGLKRGLLLVLFVLRPQVLPPPSPAAKRPPTLRPQRGGLAAQPGECMPGGFSKVKKTLIQYNAFTSPRRKTTKMLSEEAAPETEAGAA